MLFDNESLVAVLYESTFRESIKLRRYVEMYDIPSL